jgi:hypothetical protein
MTTAVPQGIWDDVAGHDVAHPRIATRVIATLLISHNGRIRRHRRRGCSMVCAVRVVEAAELIAAEMFKNADEHRYRITFGDVERHLAELANHAHGCSCGRCVLVPRVSAQRVCAIASGWQREVRATRVRAMR